MNTIPNFNILAIYDYFYLSKDLSFEVSLSQNCACDSGISGHPGIKVPLTVDSHPFVLSYLRTDSMDSLDLPLNTLYWSGSFLISYGYLASELRRKDTAYMTQFYVSRNPSSHFSNYNSPLRFLRPECLGSILSGKAEMYNMQFHNKLHLL